MTGRKVSILLAALLLLVCGCGNQALEPEDWGSFTWEKTFSHDGTYYALQSTEEIDGVSQVVVSVYRAEDDGLVDSFVPARAWDFWGICWERDSYRIWIQSADIGIHCYEYADGTWELNPAAVRPAYILSKYD